MGDDPKKLSDEHDVVTSIFKNENQKPVTDMIGVSEKEISADEFAELFPNADKEVPTTEPENLDPWARAPSD